MSDQHDPKITDLLRQANEREEAVRQHAYVELQSYRREALGLARADLELPEKERRIAEARERLKDRLRGLLSGGPRLLSDSIHFVIERARLVKEHGDAVADVRTRERKVWLEMLGREVQLLVMDGFSPPLAQVAANNNLALRRKELDEEVLSELARLQAELNRKLERLAEDEEDEG